MKHVGVLFASFHCVLQSVRNTVEVVEVLSVHFGEILIAKLVEMLKRPELHQLGIYPKRKIWNSTTLFVPLLDYVLATVPRTEEVTDQRHDLFDCTHTPLVLVSNYSHISPVDRLVHPKNEGP